LISTACGISTWRISAYSFNMLSSLWASNLNFGKGFLQLGESVNICLLMVARPAPAATMRGIVAEDELKARAKWKFLGDLAPAPAGDFGDSVNITRQPAGAV
jgi:hypothetical protein